MSSIKKHLKDKLKYWKKRLKEGKEELKSSEDWLKRSCEKCLTKKCVGYKQEDVKKAEENIVAYEQLINQAKKEK